MKRIIKEVVAIDVAQDELVVCLGKIDEELTSQLYAHKTFDNTRKGFETLVQWVDKLSTPDIAVRYVMEATGVYHEPLAYWLDEHNRELSVILPNKISNYVRTLETKTQTDKTASEAIALFGLSRRLEKWSRPQPLYKKLRQLTRERSQLTDEKVVLKNQLHAERSEAEPNKKSISRATQRLSLVNRQIKEIKEELEELVRTGKDIKEKVELMCSIPGIGMLSAVTILSETNGFELIRNKRQLTSYAGLDVKEKQSGTSVKGKSVISKRGNKKLRKAMYMPALAAIRSDERMKDLFTRLVSKHGIKMKGAVAVQRKLLEMSYTLFKTAKPYDKEYLQKLGGNQ